MRSTSRASAGDPNAAATTDGDGVVVLGPFRADGQHGRSLTAGRAGREASSATSP